jgi:hypothetical protein
MAPSRIPSRHSGWGIFLPAEPSILSTDKQSSRRHTRSRTRRAQSQVTAPMSCLAPITGDPYVRDLHHWMGHVAGGISMQRAWAVGVSIMCINLRHRRRGHPSPAMGGHPDTARAGPVRPRTRGTVERLPVAGVTRSPPRVSCPLSGQ